MPPRHYLVDILPTLSSDSPFLLASQTIMTLVPHPLDQNPQSAQSKRLRSAASTKLGQQTIASIERNMDTQSLEIVQALTILAVWEWGSTNDAESALGRCRQAIEVATNMGITNMDHAGAGYALEGIDWRKDAHRRSWWILYAYQMTAALVSGATAVVGPDDDRIKVDFPVCSDKDRTWSTWINCIRQCYRVIGIVNELVFANGGPEGMASKWGAQSSQSGEDHDRDRFLEVDKVIMSLMKETERMSVIEIVPGGEEDVAKNQQIATRFALAVAHIHIHRWTAFPEVSIFSQRICGFPKPTPFGQNIGSLAPIGPVDPLITPMPAASVEAMSPATTQSGYSPYPMTTPPGSQPGSQRQSTVPAGVPNAFMQFDQQQQQGQLSGDPNQLPLYSNSTNQGDSTIVGSAYRDQEVFQVDQMMANLHTTPAPFDSPRPQTTESPLSRSHTQATQAQPQAQYTPGPGAFNMSSESINSFAPTGAPAYTNGTGVGLPQQQQSYSAAASSSTNPGVQQWNFDVQQNVTDDLWVPETFPSHLPAPWFSQPNGASALAFDSPEQDIKHYPLVDAPAAAVPTPPPASSTPTPALASPSATKLVPGEKHRAWGIDEKGDVAPNAVVEAAERAETFPPGISLARCATAAHTIVRLEILHRSAALAMDGPPRWIPFCSCGLVSGAYAFLLLILAVQSQNAFEPTPERAQEIRDLLTNVRVIVAGLEAYGIMWEGIDRMAREVTAIVDAAEKLPLEIADHRTVTDANSPQQQPGQW
jgi:hypothetical protein